MAEVSQGGKRKMACGLKVVRAGKRSFGLSSVE